jgi:hypothetical protein
MNETIPELVEAIGEKAQQLKELKAKSPEVAEALAIAEEHQRLLKLLEEKCSTPATPTIVPMPYPVYPIQVYPTYPNPWRYEITCGTTNATVAAGTGLTLGWNSGCMPNASSVRITAGARGIDAN